MTDDADELHVTELEWTCEGAPMQADGRLSDGRYLYFRARHNSIRLGVGDIIETAQGSGGAVHFHVTVAADNGHPVSWLPTDHARHLVDVMVGILARAERYASRTEPTLGDRLRARVGRTETAEPTP